MATVFLTDISNQNAAPPVHTPSGKVGGRDRVWMGTHELVTTDGDSVGDVIVFARVPIDTRLNSLQTASDDLGTTFTADIGLYKDDSTSAPTVVDADEFASAVDYAGAAVALTEHIFEATATDKDRIGKRLWEWAGETVRPTDFQFYLIALTVVTTTTAPAGTFSWIIKGTID